jgi:hypothetical protein
MNMGSNYKLFVEKISGTSSAIERLESIWRSYYSKSIRENCHSPLIPREIKTNTIVFMSINPSLRKKDVFSAKKGYKPIPENDSYFIDSCIKLDKEDIHFTKFFEIGERIGQSQWTVMDLLYLRETNQQNVEKIINTELGEIFILDQMKLTFDILKEIQPKAVVVSNKGVVRLINQYSSRIKLDLDYPNESNGFIYRINGIPFVTLESQYLGSQQWCNRDKKDGNKRLNILISEIKRVLAM